MLGPTITTVPIRLQLSHDQSVSSFLKFVHQQATDIIPFEQTGLQNIGRLSSEIKEAINFRNLIVIQSASTIDGQSGFLDSEIIDVAAVDFDTYPLILECGLREGGFDIQARYDEGVISTWQLKKALHLFEHVVHQLNSSSGTEKLGDLDMFSSEDKSQVWEWNSNTLPAKDTCVPEVFALQVHATPDALAVSAWDGDLTYQELDRLSNKLAHHLVTLGVGPEKMIPLCFDKSRWAVVAMLSVMKAGGACVNLGPSHPQARLMGILQDTGADFLLVAPQHAHLFDSFEPGKVVIEPTFIESLFTPAAGSPLPTISSTNPAFVLFTSGSTGKSKGIVVEHGSLCTSSEAHGSTWKIEAGTRVFNFANFTFDVSVADIFTTIQRGGCVCLPSEEDRVNDLGGAIRGLDANWAFLTPSVATMLNPESVPGLKTLVFGGEAPTKEVIEKWADHLDLICCYGPAEATIYCSGNKPAQRTSDPGNLGHPIGVHFWVVDVNNHNRLVPVGCVGELLLEGRTVARGYLHEPVKTAAAFIKNPAWLPKGNEDRRIYKTGDLVKYNPDGSVRFVTRKDTQLKIRGQRVELGEIESNIMASLPGLQRVTVDVGMPELHGGRQTLVAFLSFDNQDEPCDSSDVIALPLTEKMTTQMHHLEESLIQTLPIYMVPSLYIPLRQTPLTLNGKADRARLRKIAATLSEDELASYSLANMVKQAPTTRTELILQKVWAATMNIEPTTISTSDNFFKVGGDSIIAMKLVGLARTKQISLTVSDVFKFPTLSGMATVAKDVIPSLDGQQDLYQPFSLLDTPEVGFFVQEHICPQIRFSQEDIFDVLPATDFQSHCVSHALLKTRGLLNYFYLDGAGVIDHQFFEQRCLQVVRDNEILRTLFVLHEAQFLQVVLKTFAPTIEIHQTEGDVKEFATSICRQDVEQKLPLGEPFVKFFLVEKTDGSEHRLIMRMSHAQYDGVCLPRIWENLVNDLDLDVAVSQAPPFSQYVRDSQLARTSESYQYWRDLLRDSSMTNVVAHSKPAYSDVYDSRITQMTRPTSLATAGVTFATVLKAAWALVLAEFGVNSDVVFGHVISGRSSSTINIENIVGACVNIIPVRVAIQPGWKALDLLQHLQEQQLSNMPFETLGFREIFKHCTDWANYTRFSSIVQHQNIDSNRSITMGGTSYDVGSFCPMADEADVAIMSTPCGEEMDISLSYGSGSISHEFSRELLSRLCNRIESISSNVNQSLLLPNLATHPAPRLPLTDLGRYVEDDKVLCKAYSMSGVTSSDVIKKIERCWKQVLDRSRMSNLELNMDTSFFEVGGDFVAVAQLSVLLERDGLVVSPEDLIDCPRFGFQVALFTL